MPDTTGDLVLAPRRSRERFLVRDLSVDLSCESLFGTVNLVGDFLWPFREREERGFFGMDSAWHTQGAGNSNCTGYSPPDPMKAPFRLRLRAIETEHQAQERFGRCRGPDRRASSCTLEEWGASAVPSGLSMLGDLRKAIVRSSVT